MVVTEVKCDRCHTVIADHQVRWKVVIAEDHVVWRGTMGEERHQRLDLCRQCAEQFVDLIQPFMSVHARPLGDH